MPGVIEKRPDRLPLPVPGVPVRRRESEALPAVLIRAARRNRHLTVPLTVPPLAWTAAQIMHAYGTGTDDLIGGAVLTGCTCFFAPYKWDRPAERWYARLSAAALWLWTWAYAELGPSAGTPSLVLGVLLVVLGTAWGIPWYRHYRPRGRRRRQRELQAWQAWWEFHCGHWSLSGSRVTEAEEKGVTVRIRIQLWAGKHTLGTVRAAVPQIESALEGRSDIGLVRPAAVPGHPSQCDLFLKRENPLREVVGWDPSLAPRSVHDDGVLGLSETGEWGRVPMRLSRFVNGRTRSGKGNDLLFLLAQLSACPDGRQVVIDLKQRAARTLIRSGAADYVITSRDEARAYLAMLCAEISARAREADTGEEQLLATESTPAIHTLIDEANPLTSVGAGDSECARLLSVGASQGAGLEVYFAVYTQYGALDESVRTDQTRMNLPLRVCYAVEHPDHGAFTLGDRSGLDASKLEEKGELLYKLGPRAQAERLRAPHVPFRLFEEFAGGNAERKGRLMLWCGGEESAVKGKTWQQWWDERWLRIDPAFRKNSRQYEQAVEEFGEPEPSSVSTPVTAADPPPEPGTETGAQVAARIAAETAGLDAAPTPAGSSAAAAGSEARKQAFCDTLAASPGGISVAGLQKAASMPRSTVTTYLGRLMDRGAVTRPSEGLYAPVPGRSVHAELGAVQAGDDALLAEAAPLRLVR